MLRPKPRIGGQRCTACLPLPCLDFLKSLFHARARPSQTEAHIAQDIVAKESGLGGVGRHGIGRKPRRAAVRLRGKQPQGRALSHALHFAHAAVESGGIGEPAF